MPRIVQRRRASTSARTPWPSRRCRHRAPSISAPKRCLGVEPGFLSSMLTATAYRRRGRFRSPARPASPGCRPGSSARSARYGWLRETQQAHRPCCTQKLRPGPGELPPRFFAGPWTGNRSPRPRRQCAEHDAHPVSSKDERQMPGGATSTANDRRQGAGRRNGRGEARGGSRRFPIAPGAAARVMRCPNASRCRTADWR